MFVTDIATTDLSTLDSFNKLNNQICVVDDEASSCSADKCFISNRYRLGIRTRFVPLQFAATCKPTTFKQHWLIKKKLP